MVRQLRMGGTDSSINHQYFKLNLSSDKRTRLQSLVETIHTLDWGTSNPVLAPPTFGDLVEIDDALLLTPPDGMNTGYVPIALRQFKN
ncbi:MAG: hypothetical protein CM1200mP22_29470 [Dehalococcoidia bacterium]|nr:MAG: hypothetical protein CM1200mP22_29470 [Dehalococcoidia bacterium]